MSSRSPAWIAGCRRIAHDVRRSSPGERGAWRRPVPQVRCGPRRPGRIRGAARRSVRAPSRLSSATLARHRHTSAPIPSTISRGDDTLMLPRGGAHPCRLRMMSRAAVAGSGCATMPPPTTRMSARGHGRADMLQLQAAGHTPGRSGPRPAIPQCPQGVDRRSLPVVRDVRADHLHPQVLQAPAATGSAWLIRSTMILPPCRDAASSAWATVRSSAAASTVTMSAPGESAARLEESGVDDLQVSQELLVRESAA